jgi:predicted short-subunit dehydrogenase-like oxidoreductase (DUF2520 family)
VQSISIIGAGRVGGALSLALARAGYRVDAIIYRGDRYLPILQSSLPSTTRFIKWTDETLTDSDILIIASGDPDIRDIADQVSARSKLPKFAFHSSGSRSSTELAALAEKGVRTGSLHPLAAVSDPESGVGRFRGAFFCVEGDDDAVRVAGSLAAAIGGKPFTIPSESKPLYHAAAVMAAGHVVALMDAAIEMMTKCGLSSDESQKVLVPLAFGAIANLEDNSPAAALTGPYARGDKAALDRHLSSFDRVNISRELRGVYLDLALRSVELMLKEGREMEALRRTILMAKQKGEC